MSEQTEWETIEQARRDPPMSRATFYKRVLPFLESRRRIGSKVIFRRAERLALLESLPKGAGPARGRKS
jgi:hypothetical protein